MRLAVSAVVLLAVLVTGCSGLPSPNRSHVSTAPTTIVVFLRPEVTAVQRKAVGSKLRAAHGVTAVRFISREEAYRRFKKAFKDKPELLNATRPEDMLESYQARFADRDDASRTLRAVRTMAGVQRAQVLPTPSPSATP